MKPRQLAARKETQNEDWSPRRRLLTTRDALVVTLAALVGLGGAGLLYLAHVVVALIIFCAVSVFGGAIKFFDWLIGE